MTRTDPLHDIGLARVRGGVFYLHGHDAFRKEEAVRALVAAHVDESTADFNVDPLRGRDVDAERLASVIATPPMMAEWRVVVVREMEGLASSAKAREVLLATAAAPPPGLALILSCTVPTGSSAKLYRELARRAHAVEFPEFTAADVAGWLMERAADIHGIEVEPAAARALGEAIGTDLGVLSMELAKLTEFAGERGRVTVEDVRAAGTHLPAQDRWAWLDLVGQARFDEALAGLPVLFAQGESGVGLVIALGTHFLRLGVAASGGARALEARLPRHQRWVAGHLAKQARKWRPVEIDAALDGLLRADRLLKASGMHDPHFLEEWLLTLAARKAAA